MASETCAFCPNPVNRHDLSTQHEITAWVSGPQKDGPKGREYTGRVAHRACVVNRANGIAPDQMELFSTENPKRGW